MAAARLPEVGNHLGLGMEDSMDVGQHLWFQKYIPVGCLRVDASDVPLELWTALELQDWILFSRVCDDAIGTLAISQTSQAVLLDTPVLKPFAGLLRNLWIRIQFKSGTARVYILPHDVDRGTIDRSQGGLNKALSLLLTQLDYSPEAWKGVVDSPCWAHPMCDRGQQKQVVEEDCSLLESFNNIPSPDPRLDAVSCDGAISMQAILDSRISGLQTTLYPNQRRSTAVLLQRELEPERIIDPRLRPALDQCKQQWYYDSVTGLVLRTPRYYDGVRGGILAEEMGTGKTLICLALILATKNWPTTPPEPLSVNIPIRPKLGSLVAIAAAAVNRHSYPWKIWRDRIPEHCIDALERTDNRAFYEVRTPLVETRKGSRINANPKTPRIVYLSSASLVIVPNNLCKQWEQEIKKHTSGLSVITVTELKSPIPPVSVLLAHDIIIFSQGRFEKIERERSNPEGRPFITLCPLEHIRFKRCIIDEGHKLGGGTSKWKSDLMKGLDNLEIESRLVVTGSPSKGLYGVDQKPRMNGTRRSANSKEDDLDALSRQEQQDLSRIGNITSKFLKARPWSNRKDEVGDTEAPWNVYVMQPRHSKSSGGRKDCLKTTLNSLIIRHRLSDVQDFLPPVNEKIVLLDGSYQDKLSLNLFSMFIIMNAVQSQRTDADYFFHSRQQKSLFQLVNNLKQASFFGGVFFSAEDIAKALETAEGFLEKKEVSISPEDEQLLRSAISFGHVAVRNLLKHLGNKYHAMPLYVKDFPGGQAGRSWSLHDGLAHNEAFCTDAGLLSGVQRFLNSCIDAPASLQLMVESGRLAEQGRIERAQSLAAAIESSGENKPQSAQASALAGNTPLGEDHQAKPKSGNLPKATAMEVEDSTFPNSGVEVAEPLTKTKIISTVSAKMSYLIDSIIKHQEKEQSIVFYDNENVAYYLAQLLEILQIKHLIYARSGLTAARRAQYVDTFTCNQKFRVLLMDISQAAYGLDMRSASRIYFINPVLNPQVEAQAIARARRISQKKLVTVETLVLRGSIEEVMVERRKSMTDADHRKLRSVLDDKPMHDWILNAQILPLPEAKSTFAQTAKLKSPQPVFGRGFGRTAHQDEDLVMGSPETKSREKAADASSIPIKFQGTKRSYTSSPVESNSPAENSGHPERSAKKARFA